MRCIELLPDLSHCIETVAKQEFWSSVSDYMANDQENPELKDKIELLKAFLETMDFGKLRSESEQYLIQGKRVKFSVYWEEDKPHYEMILD
jgi:hypothetical protein